MQDVFLCPGLPTKTNLLLAAKKEDILLLIFLI